MKEFNVLDPPPPSPPIYSSFRIPNINYTSTLFTIISHKCTLSLPERIKIYRLDSGQRARQSSLVSFGSVF